MEQVLHLVGNCFCNVVGTQGHPRTWKHQDLWLNQILSSMKSHSLRLLAWGVFFGVPSWNRDTWLGKYKTSPCVFCPMCSIRVSIPRSMVCGEACTQHIRKGRRLRRWCWVGGWRQRHRSGKFGDRWGTSINQSTWHFSRTPHHSKIHLETFRSTKIHWVSNSNGCIWLAMGMD